MEKTEEKVIRALIENLRKSTITKWNRGGIDEWSEFAGIMKKCIKDSSCVLESLLESEVSEKIEESEKQ